MHLLIFCFIEGNNRGGGGKIKLKSFMFQKMLHLIFVIQIYKFLKKIWIKWGELVLCFWLFCMIFISFYIHQSFTRSTVDRLKALKMNESYFILLSIPSMFMTLCQTLVGYLISFVYICLNCVFLRVEDELPTRPPPPSLWSQGGGSELRGHVPKKSIYFRTLPFLHFHKTC